MHIYTMPATIARTARGAMVSMKNTARFTQEIVAGWTDYEPYQDPTRGLPFWCHCPIESWKPLGLDPRRPWRDTVAEPYSSGKTRNECAPQRENHGAEPPREVSRLEDPQWLKPDGDLGEGVTD